MSDAEAQEKMILWKLRSSVARQISSARGSAKSADTVEQGMSTIYRYYDHNGFS